MNKISNEEMQYYNDMAKKRFGNQLVSVDAKVIDDDNVELTYNLKSSKFERIRRITGYLVGTTDRWNNAKQSEERDRVKHEV